MESAELRIAEEFLVGGEPDLVKQQLLELKVGRRRGVGLGWGPGHVQQK